MFLSVVDDSDHDECERIVFKTVYVKMMCISFTGHIRINDTSNCERDDYEFVCRVALYDCCCCCCLRCRFVSFFVRQCVRRRSAVSWTAAFGRNHIPFEVYDNMEQTCTFRRSIAAVRTFNQIAAAGFPLRRDQRLNICLWGWFANIFLSKKYFSFIPTNLLWDFCTKWGNKPWQFTKFGTCIHSNGLAFYEIV